VGLTNQFLRGLARYHDEHQDDIAPSLAAGRHPRRAFLVAHRGTDGSWLVTRENLAAFLERRRPPAVRVAYDLTLTTEKSRRLRARHRPDAPPTLPSARRTVAARPQVGLGDRRHHRPRRHRVLPATQRDRRGPARARRRDRPGGAPQRNRTHRAAHTSGQEP